MAKLGLSAREVVCLEQLLSGYNPDDICKLFAGEKEEEMEGMSTKVVQTIHGLANRINDLWDGDYNQNTLYGFYLEVSPRDTLFLYIFLDAWDNQENYAKELRFPHDTPLIIACKAYGSISAINLSNELLIRIRNLASKL